MVGTSLAEGGVGAWDSSDWKTRVASMAKAGRKMVANAR
jgi:hypothetical protein